VSATAAPVAAGRRIGTGDSIHGEVVDFLVDEAALLDDDRYTEWLALLAPDVEYRIPTARPSPGPPGVVTTSSTPTWPTTSSASR
jgi:hypothetical protein